MLSSSKMPLRSFLNPDIDPFVMNSFSTSGQNLHCRGSEFSASEETKTYFLSFLHQKNNQNECEKCEQFDLTRTYLFCHTKQPHLLITKFVFSHAKHRILCCIYSIAITCTIDSTCTMNEKVYYKQDAKRVLQFHYHSFLATNGNIFII